MKHFFKLLSLFSFLILFSGCYTYQMSSWSDDDGIYVSSTRNYNYGQYFSDLANEIVEEYEDSGIADSEDPDNMPWGYKPDQVQIFIDFYPRMYGYGYPYGYGYGYPYGYGYGYPYGYGYGYPYGCGYGYGSPYLCRYYGYGYGYYGYGYESHNYWPYRNRLRLYPYYNRNNYNGYAYNKDKDYVNSTRPGYSNSSSRRGEKTTSGSGASSENQSDLRNLSGLSISSRSGGYNISSNDVPNLRAIKDTYRTVDRIQRNLNSNSRYINSSRYNNYSTQYSGSIRRDMSNSNSRANNGNYGKSSFSRGSSSNVGSRSSGGSSGGSRGGSSSGGGSRGGAID